jgi:hypothetical protein
MRRPHVCTCLCAALIFASCTGRIAVETQVIPGPSGDWERLRQDSVPLLLEAPSDSVILRRGNATILFSIHDVRRYWTEISTTLPREAVELRDRIEADYARAGWAELDEGALPEAIAARMIADGRAAIRMGPRGRMLPWVWMMLDRNLDGTTAVDDRLFYAPDGTLFLRVRHALTMS